jgi:pullulanase
MRSLGPSFIRLLPVLLLAALATLLLAGSARAEEVTFAFTPPAGRAIQSASLRGSMNDWGETPMTRGDDGGWRVTVDLPPGEHQYKYFIDGQWPSDMSTGLDGGPLDPAADGYADDGYGGKNAVRRVGGPAVAATPSQPRSEVSEALEPGHARIHYHRPGGDYFNGWGLHVWEDSAEPGVTWTNPLLPTGGERYGVYWDVALKPGAKKLGFIVHKGDVKDPGPDMFLMLEELGREVWLVSGRDELFTEPPDVAALALGDLTKSRAHWLDRSTIAWNIALKDGDVVRLHAAPLGELELLPTEVRGGVSVTLNPLPAGMSRELAMRYPHLAGQTAFSLDMTLDRVAEVLKGRIAVSVTGADGRLRDATGVQIPGVLDPRFVCGRPRRGRSRCICSKGPTGAQAISTSRTWKGTMESGL